MDLDLVCVVAERALDYRYRMWGFGEGMALLGVLRAAEALDRPQWTDAVADLVTPTLSAPADHLVAIEVLIELHRQRPAIDVAPAIRRFAAAVAGSGVHRPDAAGLDTTVWVDCLHTDGPGLLLAGQPEAAAEAVRLGCERLQDDSGLFSHGFDVRTGGANGVHWGRGQGWALHGLLAVRSPQTACLLEALGRHEEDGHWRTIIDDPTAPIEHSVSAHIAAALLGGDRHALGLRALRAAVGALDARGGLPVSAATPVGDRDVYLSRDIGVFPWGQGPLLLALLEAVR